MQPIFVEHSLSMYIQSVTVCIMQRCIDHKNIKSTKINILYSNTVFDQIAQKYSEKIKSLS